MQKTSLKIYTYALFAMLCWGLSFIWVKVVFNYYKPLTVVFLRLSVASLILLAISMIINRHEKINAKDFKTFLMLAFWEPFCYFLGESFGMQYVSPTVAAIIISTIPVFTPIIAFFFLKERISLMNIAGLALSCVGIIVMVSDRDFGLSGSPLGIFLEFCAVVSALFYALFIKKLSSRYSTLKILTMQNILGTIYFLPLFLIFEFSHFITVTPNSELVTNMLLLTIFPSIISFLLYIKVIREIGISRSNVFVNMIPIFTAVFSFFMLNEVFTLYKSLGMAVVIAGLFLSQVTFKKQTDSDEGSNFAGG